MCSAPDNCSLSWLGVIWFRPDSRLAPIQWETLLHRNAVYHWIGASLESALWLVKWTLLPQALPINDSLTSVCCRGNAVDQLAERLAAFVDWNCCSWWQTFISYVLTARIQLYKQNNIDYACKSGWCQHINIMKSAWCAKNFKQIIDGKCCMPLLELKEPAAITWIRNKRFEAKARCHHFPYSIAFSLMKMCKFWLCFDWILFPRVQLTIFQHCFR